jgi:hypothetical protein
MRASGRAERPLGMSISPLRRFMLAAVLWLPAAFALWFACASLLVWPVVQIVKFILSHGWPNDFLSVTQGADVISSTGQLVARQNFAIQINTNLLFNAVAPGQAARFAYYDLPSINPMIYGYSIPLFAGLVMATPLQAWRRTVQILSGLVILWLVQSFGVLAETFKDIGLTGPPEGVLLMAKMGLSGDVIALCYQFGYLILPPLVPAVMWILLNRLFIEELTQHGNAALPTAGTSVAAAQRPLAEPNHDDAVEHR